jgi:hypothetical protein
MVLEEFEDAKGAIRIRISKKNQTTQWPKEKVQKDRLMLWSSSLK